jgi:hypothetical protein
MAIPSSLERLGYDGPSGCIATGLHREVLTEGVATRTILAEESNSLFLFDTAAGTVFTLPAPAVGMVFDFAVTVSNTSNLHKVITSGAAIFLVGGVTAVELAAAMDFFVANGTTHVALSMGATTTGGLVGSRVRFECISATQWLVTGIVCGSGTLADPFSTS